MDRFCSICTIIKDEIQYLQEWIDYNLSIGMKHIYIYEDIDSESHKDICDNYPDTVSLFYINDIVEYIDVNNKQITVFKYFLKEYKNELDYVAFIDIDEFIMFDEDYSLNKLLNEFQGYNGVYLYWKTYGANMQIENDPTKGVLERFTKIADTLQDDAHFDFKTILNTKKEEAKMKTHHEVFDGVTTELSYEYTDKTFKKAWINHYFTKSWEEWAWRFHKRGDIVKNHRRIEQFFETNKDMEHLKEELIDEVITKYNLIKINHDDMENVKNLDIEKMERRKEFEERFKKIREERGMKKNHPLFDKNLFMERFEKFKQLREQKKQEN